MLCQKDNAGIRPGIQTINKKKKQEETTGKRKEKKRKKERRNQFVQLLNDYPHIQCQWQVYCLACKQLFVEKGMRKKRKEKKKKKRKKTWWGGGGR